MRSLLTLLLLIMAAPAVRADSFWHDCWKSLARPFCCPDDYHQKPLPRPGCASPLGCNDYCKKPLPRVDCASPLGCNDYCKKPWTTCPTIGSGPWYTCGPGACCEPGRKNRFE
jgi:hypothetical protein